MGSWAASPAWESCSSEAQYTMGMGCRLLSALLLFVVVCEFGAADNGVAGDGSRHIGRPISGNIGRPISRTARATSENKLGKRKRTKAKNNGKNIGKPARSTKNNRRKTKKKKKKKKKK